MEKFNRLNLQLFAGEGTGDGGGEAAAGETGADAGHQRLRELGVPEGKIRKNRAYKSAGQVSPAQEQAAAAQNPTEENGQNQRMRWEDILKDPEYNRQIQNVVQQRLRDAKGAEEAMEKLSPALERLARRYGQDPENPDYEALARAIGGEDSPQHRQAVQRQSFRQHIKNLERQGEELKRVFPGFDLRTELRNPVFARMTSPGVGISVEDAYHALHRRQIQAAAMRLSAQATAQQIANDIRSGGRRPQENGVSGQASSVTTFDYSKATPEQRKAMKAYIRSEAANGRMVYPGSYPGRG